jgi:hypothetical protein
MSLLDRLLGREDKEFSKAAKKPTKNIIPVSVLMEELGVRTQNTIGSFSEEENPDKRSIEHYIAMQENDGTVKAVTQLFSMPIVSTPVKILASDGDKGERDFIETVLMGPQRFGGMSTPLQFIIEDMTRAIFEGFRLYEKVPQVIEDGPYAGLIGWKKIAPRDSTTVSLRTDENGGFAGARQTAYFGGRFVDVLIPPEKCMLYTFQKSKNWLYGESILKTAWYHYDKKHKLYYLAHKKAEIDAVGLKILKLSKPSSEQEVQAAEDVIDTIGVNSRVTLPPGFELEIDRSSSGYDVLPLIEHHDSQIVLSTLAQAITMGTRQTYAYTYGRGYETQGEFVIQMLHAIMHQMENTINEWAIPQLIDWNFGTQSYPKIKLLPLRNEVQNYMLDMFSTLLKKDPSSINGKFVEGLTANVAEKMGISIQEEEKDPEQVKKEALIAFEKGKLSEADSQKVASPKTSQKTKDYVFEKAILLQYEPDFAQRFESMGRQFVLEDIEEKKRTELSEARKDSSDSKAELALSEVKKILKEFAS